MVITNKSVPKPLTTATDAMRKRRLSKPLDKKESENTNIGNQVTEEPRSYLEWHKTFKRALFRWETRFESLVCSNLVFLVSFIQVFC